MGWRLSRRWDLPAAKREPHCDVKQTRGHPHQYTTAFPPHGEMAQKPWQCCHLLGDAGTEEHEEGPGTEMELIYRCFKNLIVNLRLAIPYPYLPKRYWK